MSALDSRRLKHQMLLQRPDTIDNGTGGRKKNPVTDGWADVAKPWAEIIALRGQEAVRENIERAVQLWRVTIRHRDDVTPQMRLVWGAIVMNITAAAPNEAGDGLVLSCESGANGR
ncbi:head-tail adaptor protein [Sphingomonas paucimobilis]|uniref:head-tail adaptor protein n=1 Tax=Sphingomonas paucimobilis TaxID=13689 RepID=UPI0030FC198F